MHPAARGFLHTVFMFCLSECCSLNYNSSLIYDTSFQTLFKTDIS